MHTAITRLGVGWGLGAGGCSTPTFCQPVVFLAVIKQLIVCSLHFSILQSNFSLVLLALLVVSS